MTSAEVLLTLQEAADIVGCHYQTLYRRVRSGELSTMIAGGTYRVRRTDLEGWLRERDARAGAVPSRRTHNWEKLQDDLFAALRTGDAKTARLLCDRLLDGGANVADLCDRLFGPTLYRIGALWHEGSLAIADEHRASRIIEGLLERAAGRSAKPGPRIGCVVVATAPGDNHALAAQMVAVGLQVDGFRVNYLGADLPTDEIVTMARRERADLVALSCCVEEHDGLHEVLSALGAERFATIVGGMGIGPSEALALGASRYGASINEAQRLARELVRTPAT